jgi:FtsZ-binding cell division protein ZapB
MANLNDISVQHRVETYRTKLHELKEPWSEAAKKQKERMTANYQAVAQQQCAYLDRVKAFLGNYTMPPSRTLFYIAFANQIWALQWKGITGNSLMREANTLIQTWVGRGLQETILRDLIMAVFTMAPPA